MNLTIDFSSSGRLRLLVILLLLNMITEILTNNEKGLVVRFGERNCGVGKRLLNFEKLSEEVVVFVDEEWKGIDGLSGVDGVRCLDIE
jgi:hypothetical protein